MVISVKVDYHFRMPSSLNILIFISLLTLLTACGPQGATDDTPPSKAPAKPRPTGCRGCHPYQPPAKHGSCVSCHRGNSAAADKETAHAALVGAPAHPDAMDGACAACHPAEVKGVAASIHLTLKKEVNRVRRAFGAADELGSLLDIPAAPAPDTLLSLADDMLRRRCLRCHLYYAGDNYPATRHGQGCAACHLAYADGSLTDHAFVAPPRDEQCLSCHYGNVVGADYYGRFEQDYNWEYRVPFGSANAEAPPFGVGFHQLAPDVHQQAGMACVDCHPGTQLMGLGRAVSCRGCHDGGAPLPPNVRRTKKGRAVRTKITRKTLDIPLMRAPAHSVTGVDCAVCHAQWSFADSSLHLLRLDEPEYDEWMPLSRQGSFEAEYYIERALFDDTSDALAVMQDKITGEITPGIWLKSYSLRRWEDITTCRDNKGTLRVCRHRLDLRLSYVDRDGEVVFDEAAGAQRARLTPYWPHTIGKAGEFYRRRLGQ